MNQKHGIAGFLGVLGSGLISALTPAIQAYVASHPATAMVAGTVVGSLASVLPSALGLGSDKPTP